MRGSRALRRACLHAAGLAIDLLPPQPCRRGSLTQLRAPARHERSWGAAPARRRRHGLRQPRQHGRDLSLQHLAALPGLHLHAAHVSKVMGFDGRSHGHRRRLRGDPCGGRRPAALAGVCGVGGRAGLGLTPARRAARLHVGPLLLRAAVLHPCGGGGKYVRSHRGPPAAAPAGSLASAVASPAAAIPSPRACRSHQRAASARRWSGEGRDAGGPAGVRLCPRCERRQLGRLSALQMLLDGKESAAGTGRGLGQASGGTTAPRTLVTCCRRHANVCSAVQRAYTMGSLN